MAVNDLLEQQAATNEWYRFSTLQKVEEYLIERSRINPVDFVTYMTDGELKPTEHQIEWFRYFFDFSSRRDILEAFPGSGKTQTTVYVLAFIIGNFPELTNMIISVSEEQATQRLGDVREVVLSQRYKNVFPHIHIDNKADRPNTSTKLNVWSSRLPDGRSCDYNQWRSFVRRKGEPRDHTVFACGIRSNSVTGKRITGFIIIDDPHSEENSATPEQRLKVVNFIKKEVLSRLTAKEVDMTKCIIIMTPWAEDDCAGQLRLEVRKGGIPVWRLRKFPIRKSDEAGGMGVGSETGEPTWEGMFGEEEIQFIQEDRGDIIFRLMYLLDEIAGSGGRVTIGMVSQPLPNPLPKFKDITITVDGAESDKLSSDFTVYHAVARDEASPPNFFILDTVRFKESKINLRVDKLIEFADRIFTAHGKLSNIIFEPDAKAMMDIIKEQRYDLPCTLVPIKGDKVLRFEPVAGMFQQLRFYVNTSAQGYDAMRSELIGFPKARHDDTVDPLSLLFQQPTWVIKKARSSVTKIKSRFLL